ncbi:recombinase family protein [Shewanella frigidimarina]|uniref:recombinase family protein n=1 Tax=Shewanella frigidimarina TaxID=56812 RepID=UPI003D7B7D64
MSNLHNRTSISYSRFSSDQQKKGDSLRRQLEIYQAIVQQHNLVDIGQAFTDEGKSAFKGKHLDGQLGALIELLQQQDLTAKPVLVIEKWDRLSRLEMNATIDLFRRVVKYADILDASDGALYTSESMNDITGYITLGLKAHQAHIYSKNLSDRVRDAKKRASLESGNKRIKGRNYPHWLKVENDIFVVVEDRASTINKMFELKMQGMGTRSIAIHLNQNFSEYKSWDNRGNVSGEWLSGTVRNHLKNIAATGVFQNKDVHTVDYYPRIISDVLFNNAQLTFKSQKQSAHNTNKRNGDNILYHVKCMCCETSMTFAKRKVSILACSRGKECTNSSISYSLVEEVTCDVLFEAADLSTDTETKVDDTADKRNELIADLNMLKQRVDENTAAGKRTSAMLLLQIDELEQEIETLIPVIKEFITKPAERYWDLLKGSVEDRLRLSRYIKLNVQKVEVLSVSRKRKFIVVVINGNRYPVEVKVKPKVGYEYWTIKGVDDGVALI